MDQIEDQLADVGLVKYFIRHNDESSVDIPTKETTFTKEKNPSLL